MPPRPRAGGRAGRGRGASLQSVASTRAADGPATSSETPLQSNDDDVVGTQPRSSRVDTASRVEVTVATSIPSGRSTPTTSLPSQTQATASRGAGRFKPKNIRRDEAERKKLEDDRARDLASKIKAEERELRAEERRARRGRGRGGMTRGLVRRTVTAQGPFSAISSENVKADFSRGDWASGSGFGGGNARNAYRHDSENRIRYHPRREHEARVNIDLLNGLTDGHAPDGTPLYQPSRYTEKSVGNLPIGMHRTLHQDPEIKVKTQAELEAEDRQSSDDDAERGGEEEEEEEGNLFVDAPARDSRNISMDNDDEVWHAAPKNLVKIKPEPDTEEADTDVDMADIPEAPHSPEARKKIIVDRNGHASDAATEKMKRKEKKLAEDLEFMYATMDLQELLRTLSLTTPAEGEEDQGKDDQLFLFQLPPILPPLAKKSDGLDGQSETIDLASSENEPKIKLEDGFDASRSTSMGLPAEGGFIGRLNVHKSGKAELDWGGTALNVRMAIETDFLTTATIIEQKENIETAEELAGLAYGMGQVLRGFTLAPPCRDDDEWDPNIDEIMRVGGGENAM
ncbi:putative RNA polymerase III RPC4 [Rosellinia necatrix]|uniref:Putative RNA polymerase III RPC4 n=1 Tax=Rosellinia necatrix TaxID=77044 RepID=A0A1S7ULD9_ROSNE|nr:putative RNA polymerase III RPC4 [Rosellinia necatrix]